MKAEDYKHVVSASGEPPLAENIILDGNVMPLRNDPKDKIKLRGEDICFLLEAGVRFFRVPEGFTRVREFTRKLLASQAEEALNQVLYMFQSGYALKTLPAPGTCYRLENSYDYMLPFDVLTVDDCEPMEPVPESGGKVEAAPFRAAFRNFQKIKGRAASTKPLPNEFSVDKIVIAQENVTPLFGGTPSEIVYDNYSLGPRKMPEPDVSVDPKDYERQFYQTLTTPVSAGDEYIPYYAQAGYLKGCRCLSGTIWQVGMHATLSWDGSYDNASGYVLSLDDDWIPSGEGRFTKLSCSGSSAMGILGKVCNFIDSGLWAKVTDNYNSIGEGEYAWCYARANAIGRIGIAATDDCLREGFNQ